MVNLDKDWARVSPSRKKLRFRYDDERIYSSLFDLIKLDELGHRGVEGTVQRQLGVMRCAVFTFYEAEDT